MKKIFTTIILFILSTNLALAKTYDFSKEPRENYYFNTFFTNEIVFDKDIKILSNEIYFFTEASSLNKKYFNSQNPFWGVYEILEKKLWYDKLKYLFEKQELWILWQKYYNFDNKNNFLDNLKNLQKEIDDKIKLMYDIEKHIGYDNTYLNIDKLMFAREYINIYSKYDKKTMIYFYPYATNKFLGFFDDRKFKSTSEISAWYQNSILPKLTIVDNSILYKDIFIMNWDKKVFWKLKYKLDKFFLDRDLYDEKKAEFIYQIVPYYEFEVDLKTWESSIYIEYPIVNLAYDWEPMSINYYTQTPNWVERIRNK